MDPNPHHSLLSYDELSNIRVRQRNLVYVVGLPLPLCDEQVLKSKTWFGGFGKIKKVHCNKKTSHASKNGSCAAYITFYRENDAKRAIESMNGRYLDDGVRMLKATTGSTKYCSYFLSGSSCSNPSKCLFLHDWANKEDVVTKGELNDFGPIGYGHHHTNGYHTAHHNAVTLHGGHAAEYEDDFDFEEDRNRTNRTVLSVGGKKAKSSASSKISKFDYTKIVKQSMAKEHHQNSALPTTGSNAANSASSSLSDPKTPRSAAKVAASGMASAVPKHKNGISNGNVHIMNGGNGSHGNHGMNGLSAGHSGGHTVSANNQHTNSHSNASSSTASSVSSTDHAFPPLGTPSKAQSHPSNHQGQGQGQFPATPSPMMNGNPNGHHYSRSNGTMAVSPSKVNGISMVKTPPVKPLKTRTKPPMGLRKQQNASVNPNISNIPNMMGGTNGTAGTGGTSGGGGGSSSVGPHGLHNGYSSHNGHAHPPIAQGMYSNAHSNASMDHSSTMSSSGRMQSIQGNQGNPGNRGNQSGSQGQALSKSERLSSQNVSTTEVVPPQISLDDTCNVTENQQRGRDGRDGRGHSGQPRYQNKSVNFDNYVDVVSGDSHSGRMYVESKAVKHQNGKVTKPRSRSQSGDHGHRPREDMTGHLMPSGSRSKPTTPTSHRGSSGSSSSSNNGSGGRKQRSKRRPQAVAMMVAGQLDHRESQSHGEMAKVLLEELRHYDYDMMLEDGDGSDSGSDYEEFKMSDLLQDGMWTSDELMMDQYNYYYFVQSEQVIFEQFHHFNAQKVQKSVKSKA